MAEGVAGAALPLSAAPTTRYRVLGAISFSHLLNDMMQSLLLAMYPLLKGTFSLSFAQIGLITLTFQFTASLLQPLVGLYTDKHPTPYSLAFGMGCTLLGLLLLAVAPDFHVVLLASALIGTGSSVFHPESSRIARLASGGRHGLAQSIFQVGGNTGSAIGPLLAAWIIVPNGQASVAWFSLAALLAMVVLWRVGTWYRQQHLVRPPRAAVAAAAGAALAAAAGNMLPRRTVLWALIVLVALMFSKFFYLTSLSSYYSFYLIQHFGLPVQTAQIYLFVFLFAVAAGTILGGPIGDRIGRKRVIWVSILGVAPFTLLLPYVDLFWTGVLSFVIGLILASAFSAILVFAQELVPGKVGAVSGLFFGFAFGIGGIGAALLGTLADRYGLDYVYRLCAFLPLLGLLTVFLPAQRRTNRPSPLRGRG